MRFQAALAAILLCAGTALPVSGQRAPVSWTRAAPSASSASGASSASSASSASPDSANGPSLRWVAVGFTVATAAAFPFDEGIARWIDDHRGAGDGRFGAAATGFRLVGFPGTVLVSGSLYAVGRFRGGATLAAAGLHSGEAIVLSEALVFGVKSLAGRARPDEAPDDATDFELGRGLREGDAFQAFPSGHTAAAFALAAALTEEHRQCCGDSAPYLGPALYGAAALVGAARVYEERHWMSDVVAGAGIGTLTGIAVVRWHHARPGRGLDPIFLPAAVTPSRDGVLLVWSARVP